MGRADNAAQRRKPARVVPLHPDVVDEIVVDGDLPPLIPVGSYDASVIGYELMPELAMYNGQSKLRIDFDVVLPNEARVTLPMYCNVRLIQDRTTRSVRLRVGANSKYARTWRTITGRRPSRHDRMAARSLVGAYVRVTVETVVESRAQERLDGVNQYSKVQRVDELLAGGHAPRC